MSVDTVDAVSFRMYELIGLFDSLNSSGVTALQKALPLFNRAMDLYKAQAWAGAKQAFKDVIDIAEDAVSRIYVERCEFFEKASVRMKPEWNGLWDEGYKALVMEVFAVEVNPSAILQADADSIQIDGGGGGVIDGKHADSEGAGPPSA